MKERILLTGLCFALAAGVMAQSTIPYQDLSQRTSRKTVERSRSRSSTPEKKPAATPAPKPGETKENAAAKPDAPKPDGKGQAIKTVTTAKPTSGTKTAAAKPGKERPARATKNQDATGQIQEVNEGMLQSLRTQRVEFDPEVMAETEGIILLNDRKIDVREKTSYRSDLAQPL